MLDEITQQFDEMGIEPTKEVLAKSMELCINYEIDDAAEFVEQWIAFSISTKNSAEPNIAALQDFERKVLQSKRDKHLAASKQKPKFNITQRRSLNNSVQQSKTVATTATAATNSLVLYGVNIDDNNFADHENVAAHEVLDSYNVHQTPKAKRPALIAAPISTEVIFSPISYSPVTGKAHLHNAENIEGSGKIVCTFGNANLISKTEWKRSSIQQPANINIQPLLLCNNASLSAENFKYMSGNLFEMCNLADHRFCYIGKAIHEKTITMLASTEQDTETSNVKLSQLEDNSAIGIIYGVEYDGVDSCTMYMLRLNDENFHPIRLSFDKTKSIALFPGQIAMLIGKPSTRNHLAVEQIYAEQQLSPPEVPRILEELIFVVAAGPYTHQDDMVYEPLHDLLHYLKEHKPNVLILIGPFMQAEHAYISELAESCESFFEKMIAGIVDTVGNSTTILLVVSHQDIHTDMVYPTPPVQLRKNYSNVHILPDPSLFDLNGLVIGITSTDIVDHILSQEVAINAGDKMKRVVNYLLNQGSFYPLHPPPVNKICMDNLICSNFANLQKIPHILVLPSDQKYFMRCVHGCFAVNPGRLENTGGGTFARFVVSPNENKDETNLMNVIGCQVRRI